jgi:F0F1-type ATP synthase membrane subunit b/b'
LSTAKTNSNPKTPTLLETLAQHELGVLEKIAQSEREAAALVDGARAEVIALQDKAAQKLEDECAAMRAAAAAERESERQAVMQRTHEQLEKNRAEVSPRIAGLVDEVVALILPSGRGTRG